MGGISDRVAGATTTLVCAPSLGTETGACCAELLAAGAAEGRAVLWVTYTRSPDACLEALPGDVPVHGVLAVGDVSQRERSLDDGLVEVVSTPEDVTALGIKLSRLLSATDEDLVVCVDSVTAMCQYVERETAYNFLHTVGAQLYATGTRAHFHLDPAAHDRATVDLFASLCDAVVELDGDAVDVRTRPVIE